MAKIAGSLWVEANTLHFVSSSGNSWYFTGTVGSTPAGAIVGSVWIDQTDGTIHYIDSLGADRSINAVDVTSRSGVGAIKGSMWVDNVANANYSLHFVNNTQMERACHTDTHTDVPAGGSHSDSHADVPHGDNGISDHEDLHGDFCDGAHWDGYSNAAHGDTPAQNSHSDSHSDSVHGDVAHADQPTNEGP